LFEPAYVCATCGEELYSCTGKGQRS
jgi:DNA-directed RNA polymerase subunit RPC12/RpoP